MSLYSEVVSGKTAAALAYVNKTRLESYETKDTTVFLHKIGEDKTLAEYLMHLESVQTEETWWTLSEFHKSFGSPL